MKQIMIVLMITLGVWACKGQDAEKLKQQENQTKKEGKEMTVAVMKTNMGTIDIELLSRSNTKNC